MKLIIGSLALAAVAGVLAGAVYGLVTLGDLLDRAEQDLGA